MKNMGKRDKDDHSKEKHKKKHKHHKSSKNKADFVGAKIEDASSNMEADVDIEVEDQRANDEASNSFNKSKDAQCIDDENIDVEVDEDEMEVSMEEDVKSIVHIEKPSSSKKTQRKLENLPPALVQPISNQKKIKRRKESGTSSEEERWLTAVESGKLEEIEDVELKKIKDPKLMTARQRAMYDRNNDIESAPGFAETLMALPTGYKEKEKPQTVEEIQKAALKTLKRKKQADEKREKDKKRTMERLLKKQESKHRSGNKPKTSKESLPMISYKNTLEGAVINLPQGVAFPLQPQRPKEPPTQLLCGILGCGQPKVYNCSKTNLPLCSFSCYRKNVQSLKEIIC